MLLFYPKDCQDDSGSLFGAFKKACPRLLSGTPKLLTEFGLKLVYGRLPRDGREGVIFSGFTFSAVFR